MIPLVDVKAQYAPLIPALKERIGEVIESGRFILGPNVRRSRRRRPPTSASRHDRRRQRHRRPRARARRDGDRRGRRGDLPVVHVLRDAGGDRPARRHARLRRHRRGGPEPRSGRCRPPDHAEDEGDHARPPLRPAGAAPGARRARRPDRRGRRTGFRCRRSRADRGHLDLQLLPDEEPLRPGRRRSRRRDTCSSHAYNANQGRRVTCPKPSRSARSRCTACPTPASWPRSIDAGVLDADRIVAVIGKTEGNGGVNDYTRIIADRAFREVIVAKGSRGRGARSSRSRSSGPAAPTACSSPHATVFATVPDRPTPRPTDEPRLTVGFAMSERAAARGHRPASR